MDDLLDNSTTENVPYGVPYLHINCFNFLQTPIAKFAFMFIILSSNILQGSATRTHNYNFKTFVDKKSIFVPHILEICAE